MPAGLSASAALLRAGDRDRYLSVLAGGDPEPEGLFALYALNLELARTAEVVREPLLGEIRLQWWQEALAAAHGGVPPAHPVLEALAPFLTGGRLPLESLQALAAARRRDLEAEPPESLDDLLAYLGKTAGHLNRLAAGFCGAAAGTEEAAQAVGEAWGLVGLLRATRHLAGQRRVLLPLELLRREGVTVAALRELRPEPGLAGVGQALADLATARLARARGLVPRLPGRGRAPLLLASLAELYLGRLRRLKWELLDPRAAEPAVGAAWRLAWQRLRRRT